MKKSIFNLLALILCVTLFSSCAKNVVIPFQANGTNTGSVKIKPSIPIKAASVTVDGNLIWDKKSRIKSLTITNMPNGNHDINVVSASWYYKEALNHKETVNLGNGENRAILVSVPPYSTGYYLYMTGVIIVCALPSLMAL